MAFDVNNFVINHPIRGIMTSTADGSYMWSINQITDPSLNITADTVDATDALGSKITTFNRAKNAEFSASNSLFDLGLYAAQLGVDKQVATAKDKITVPAFETITVKTGEASVNLAHTPKEDLTALYQLKGDGTLGTVYTANTSASASQFVQAGATITLPTGIAAGTQLLAMYEYESENAVAVTGDAVNFPKAGKFILEVLGADVCDPTTLIHAYIIFPNAKLDSNVDLSFTTDGNHPFTIQANQAYCDAKKILFQIVVPQEA